MAEVAVGVHALVVAGTGLGVVLDRAAEGVVPAPSRDRRERPAVRSTVERAVEVGDTEVVDRAGRRAVVGLRAAPSHAGPRPTRRAENVPSERSASFPRSASASSGSAIGNASDSSASGSIRAVVGVACEQDGGERREGRVLLVHPRQEDVVACPGQRHVEQPHGVVAVLLRRAHRSGRALALLAAPQVAHPAVTLVVVVHHLGRPLVLVQPDRAHDAELEALRLVDRHDRHRGAVGLDPA